MLENKQEKIILAPQTSAAEDDARRQRDERQCDKGDRWTTTTPA
jgi:hypothetical protein